jgi:hypothetical protein
MIDLNHEAPLPLAEACHLIPPGRGGRRTHLSTVLRWILRGAKAPDGTTVRLEGLRLGGRWMTSRAALQRFAEALTPRLGDLTADGRAAGAAPRTPRQRQRAAQRAGDELERLGV